MIEAQVFSISQVFGKINDNCRQSRALDGSVSRKPDRREKRVAVCAPSVASKFGAELRRAGCLNRALKGGNKLLDGSADQNSVFKHKEITCRFVCQQNLPAPG